MEQNPLKRLIRSPWGRAGLYLLCLLPVLIFRPLTPTNELKYLAIADEALAQTGVSRLLVTGGVACSRFLRTYCKDKNYVFGDARLCSDNAVGVSLFGGARCR